jgi:hypothetical protein
MHIILSVGLSNSNLNSRPNSVKYEVPPGPGHWQLELDVFNLNQLTGRLRVNALMLGLQYYTN